MLGNFVLLVILPLASRGPSHVSSILMYTYPASRMPLDTIASATPRTTSSETLPANLFQLFQPMGGVRASPLSGTSCSAGTGSLGGGNAASGLLGSATPCTGSRPSNWEVMLSLPSCNVPS